MKNLEFQELSRQEALETTGGCPILPIHCTLIAIEVAHAASDFWDGAVDRFNKYRKQ